MNILSLIKMIPIFVVLAAMGWPLLGCADDGIESRINVLEELRLQHSPLLHGGNGILTKSIVPKSQAEKAGIQAGDIIVTYDGHPVDEADQFTSLIQSIKEEHRAVSIGIIRNRVFQSLSIRSGRIGVQISNVTSVSNKPILRLETGMHTAMIWRIGVDAAGRYLVSASEDKTLRVWSLPEMVLLNTLRVPIGVGHEGKIFATAISPDGRWIAAGGVTGYEWNDASIYLFDRATGQMFHRISGLGNVIRNLAISSEGSFLAASLGAGGVRVWNTHNWKLVGKDTDYGSDSYSCEFSRDGRLLTTSYDGYLRLYDTHFRLQQKRKAAGGKRPHSARFSADGSKIAVGFADFTRVNVLDGHSLRLLYAPDTRGVNGGGLSSVAWEDGFLYAGGSGYHAKLRRWSDGGRGEYRDLPVSNNTIMDIRPLPGGGVAVSSADPAITLLDPSGNKVKQRLPVIADYRQAYEKFTLSQDGRRIRFGLKRFGGSPSLFDLGARQLTSAPASIAGLAAPDTQTPNHSSLTIRDWENTTHPTLNGNPLKLAQYETSRSLAIAPNRHSFLLGTEWYVRRFDANGDELWHKSAPGMSQGVNISADGKLAVAAFGDGTIRWYRYSDGKLLLSLFPHKDGKRWVAWTPSGYYDASSAAEGLIGWHLNSGKDRAASFYPASKFHKRFYRPDIVAEILGAGSEAEAIRLADAARGRETVQTDVKSLLPPDIWIVSPENGTRFSGSTVTVRYKLRSPSGEKITGIKVLVDGRPVTLSGINTRGIKITGRESGSLSMDVPVPAKDCTIALMAENRYATSDPSLLRLTWKGKTRAQAGFVIKPKLYVLAIGVSDYNDPRLKLGLAAKDARDFAVAIKAQSGGLYRDVVVKSVTDKAATRDDILDGLDWIELETTSKDVAMVFLAGHGVNDHNGNYYYLPVDVKLNHLKRTGVSFSDIKTTVESLAGKTLFFVDTCHSGNVMGARRGVADINAVVNELTTAEVGAVVFASSSGNQFSLEKASWGNGAFTKALLEGFAGKADYSHTGRITINMLDLYLSERVKALTHGAQTPTTTKPRTIADFPVALKR